jgi:hypothetical protein
MTMPIETTLTLYDLAGGAAAEPDGEMLAPVWDCSEQKDTPHARQRP